MEQILLDKDSTDPEFTLLYERLIYYLEHYAFTPLEVYNATNLKKCDREKLLTNEDLNVVKSIFNEYRMHYIDQVRSEIKNFVGKYDLKEKLTRKSEAFVFEMVLKDLGLSVDDLKQMDEISELGSDESSLMHHYVNQYTEDKNEFLEKENERLKEELRVLREKNDLKFI